MSSRDWPPRIAHDWGEVVEDFAAAQGQRERGPAQNTGAPDPYVRWGDTVQMNFGSLNNGVVVVRREFARISLPRPLVCQLNYSFRAVPAGGAPLVPLVDFTLIEYSTGVGSSAVPIRRVYAALPQVPTESQPTGTPLDVSHVIAVHNLYAAVEAQAFDCALFFTVWLSPVSLEQL